MDHFTGLSSMTRFSNAAVFSLFFYVIGGKFRDTLVSVQAVQLLLHVI